MPCSGNSCLATTPSSRSQPNCRSQPTAPGIPQRALDEILCFKHTRKVARDNTVKYQWRTLQLLPGTERPSYAGVQVEVLEHTDGRLQIRYQGEIIPCRQAPPRPGVLRASHGALAPTPELNLIVKRLGNHRLSQPQLRQLANLEPEPVEEVPLQSASSSAETSLPPPRELTPRQLASGKRCNTPGFRASPCGRSPARSGSLATPCASTPAP